jgi:hypothetical protein
LEESKPTWFAEIFKKSSNNCRTGSLLFPDISRSNVSTGKLELFYDVPFSMDRKTGWPVLAERLRKSISIASGEALHL